MRRSHEFETTKAVPRPNAVLLACVLVAVGALLACSKSEQAAPQQRDASSSATEPSMKGAGNCGNALYTGFENPQQAYAAYAEAINAGSWCSAINTFAPEARGEVVIANFKALAILAGTDNPKRVSYQERFGQFCAKHQLSCASAESATTMAQALLTGVPLESELAQIRSLVASGAEDLYVDLMASMASVDASAISKFDVPLSELEVHGERATGKAQQTNGKVSTLPFVKTAPGWLLAFR